jgi:hypothetical protein
MKMTGIRVNCKKMHRKVCERDKYDRRNTDLRVTGFQAFWECFEFYPSHALNKHSTS